MIRKASLALFAILFMVSCASRQKQPDAGAGAMGGGADDAIVADKEMSFSPQGSDSGQIPGLGTVYFEYDQARLTQDARRQLAENADWMKRNPTVTMQIEGHTDSRGSIEYNLSLGERRAQSVKTYMSSLGIEARRMTIISYGEEKPINPAESEAAWAKNRRANFVPLAQ